MDKLTSSETTINFRPIVSSIGTYIYQLAKFLRDLLSPLVNTEFCTKDSFSFVKEISQVNLHKQFLVSYDVTSLYTNFLLQETIDIAVNSIMLNNKNFKITKNDLKKLFNFATSPRHFLFKGHTYDQIDGVAMGSPLAPVLAKFFKGHFENN
ncbi:uncharacterized protein LOC136086305 [Hydra vulgaris]|uniref:Uncharacterized protein LOC136086305 n=1 Tax=Hydra vulgaris TaxID=6087 RepID=A0ABM4CS20_HYDVU